VFTGDAKSNDDVFSLLSHVGCAVLRSSSGELCRRSSVPSDDLQGVIVLTATR
jgi:hypothetical protein